MLMILITAQPCRVLIVDVRGPAKWEGGLLTAKGSSKDRSIDSEKREIQNINMTLNDMIVSKMLRFFNQQAVRSLLSSGDLGPTPCGPVTTSCHCRQVPPCLVKASPFYIMACAETPPWPRWTCQRGRGHALTPDSGNARPHCIMLQFQDVKQSRKCRLFPQLADLPGAAAAFSGCPLGAWTWIAVGAPQSRALCRDLPGDR